MNERKLIICDLCEVQCNNYYIQKFEGLNICCSCASTEKYGPSDIFDNIKNVVLKNNIECPVCWETTRGIKLPNCDHLCCINCFKSLFFGFINIEKSKNFYSQEREDPYDIMFPTGNKEEEEEEEEENNKINHRFNEYSQWCYDFYFAHLGANVEEIENMYKERAMWMNTPEFLEWEEDKNKWEEEELERENMQNEYFYEKMKTRNPLCPLCRK